MYKNGPVKLKTLNSNSKAAPDENTPAKYSVSSILSRPFRSHFASTEKIRLPLRERQASNETAVVLSKPFKCPSFQGRKTVLPPRKRKKVNYKEMDNGCDADEGPSYEERLAQALIDNDLRKKFPVFQVKDKESIFKRAFVVPNAGLTPEMRNKVFASLGMRRQPNLIARPLYDPADELAIILYDPTLPDPIEEEERREEEEKKRQLEEAKEMEVKPTKVVYKTLNEILGIPKRGEEVKKDRPRIAVVVDPKLGKILRPHQVEGVKFLYNCTTGRVLRQAKGCIMADEMGLGKTLQCITLLWTLLKQSHDSNKPTISKCIIACPSTLVKNWANELIKWLGEGTLTPFTVDGRASKTELIRELRQWITATGRNITRPVLIISYESLRLYSEYLQSHEVGLLLCDEGHRLKNDESLTFVALDALNVKRRVILSGTPIQNDLTEYFSLINFANPGLLGTKAEFRKNWEVPILRGRDALSTEQEQTVSDQKLSELGAVANKFIIRRTNDILSKYLPVKYEHVVFCRLSPLQTALYNHFITSPEIRALLKGKGSQPLKAIGLLRKLCNHPDLLDIATDFAGCEAILPQGYVPPKERGYRDRVIVDTTLSGKMLVLERMLDRIRRETNDKIVLISNFTQTLDLFENLCRSRNYGCIRLDGKMAINKRQKMVDRFNNPENPEFVFLLSSKAGGCGINLVGANRLILFDPDWNPAADQQALARVWRDGQKKDCFVYRFISTGTIEEKIFQRQSHKQSLSSCVVDEQQDVERHFSLADMRQLFEFNGPPSDESLESLSAAAVDTNTHNWTLCDTHDTFKCKRCRNNEQFVKAPAYLYGDTSSWNHYSNKRLAKIEDQLMRQESELDDVTFCFQYVSV